MPERLGGMAALLDIPDDIAELVVIWVDQGFNGSNFANAVALCMRCQGGGNQAD